MVAVVTVRVAVLGMGNMGGAMVGTLRQAGHEVLVWSRTAAKAEAAAAKRAEARRRAAEKRLASATEAVRAAEARLEQLRDEEARARAELDELSP